MQRTANINGFEVTVTPVEVKIDSLSFAPAQVDRICSLVSTAGAMRDFKALPEKIEDPPFSVYFSEDGGISLKGEQGEVRFKLENADTLIETFRMALQIALDNQKYNKNFRRPRAATGPEGADIFEGRN